MCLGSMPQFVNSGVKSHNRCERHATLWGIRHAPTAPATPYSVTLAFMPTDRRHRRNFNEPGHAHALTFSCYRRLPFLNRDRTRRWLIEAIEEARRSSECDVWAYVIMPEHVHLIVRPRPREYDIAQFRKAIKEPVGRKATAYLSEHAPIWLDRITRTRGSRTERLFWQSGGGYDRNITEPATLMRTIDYVHLNPVRRGLVKQARDWPWSSAAWFEGIGDSPLIPDPIPPEWLTTS